MTYDRDSGPLYEIVIGGWGNGQCCLRKSKQGSCYRTYRGSVLNCGSYQYFWVSWGGSVIRLGRGTTYGSNTLMSLSDSSIRVNYIAVSTGWGSTGYWEFYNPPVHGGWSSWSGYGSCSKSCGSGSQSRSRSCNNPSPAYGGNSCSGSSISSRSCNTHNCPIDGGWSTWSGYGSCSKTCGTGTQSRSRSCTNPAPAYNGLSCSGSATSSQNCNTHNCPIDGQWATWGSWTTCSVTCGGGSQSRTRTCTNPAPQYNGSPCPNSASSTQACNTHHCPIDGGLSSWGSWGTCTVTCGGGTQDRLRTCTNPAPQYGGALCVGATTNTQDCNTQVCIIDGAWSSWSGYGLCSVSCGGGKQSRSRTCTNPKPANGGLDCPGGASELTDCNVDVCPTVPAGQYQQLCPAGWFTCETGGITCIDEAFQCDCSKDCDDGSDEDATYASCTVTQMASCKSSGGHMTLSIMAAMLPVLGMVLLQIIL